MKNLRHHEGDIITFIRPMSKLFINLGVGAAIGYIGVTSSHPWAYLNFNSIQLPCVHGGWTYDDIEKIDGVKYYIFGIIFFDTDHGGYSEEAAEAEILKVVPDFQAAIK